MTAAALLRTRSAGPGMRRVDPARDMAGIADVVESAFASQLDPAGLRMLREMRALGRAGWIGWAIGRLLLPPAANPDGFVWIEEGKVVGNASLLAVQGRPERWVMANVAVMSTYRRRGIARAMVQACLDLAKERHATVLVLQVKSVNEGARALYASLGFRTLATRTTWSRPPGQRVARVETLGHVRRRVPADWAAEWALAQRIFPEGLFWPYPLDPAFFRPSNLLASIDLDRKRHWVWHESAEIQACLVAQARAEEGGWRLALMVDAEARGRAESALLAQALRELPFDMPMLLDYPAGVAQDVLQAHGFKPDRTLTWMSIDLASGRGAPMAPSSSD